VHMIRSMVGRTVIGKGFYGGGIFEMRKIFTKAVTDFPLKMLHWQWLREDQMQLQPVSGIVMIDLMMCHKGQRYWMSLIRL